jgi:hypothetical protein
MAEDIDLSRVFGKSEYIFKAGLTEGSINRAGDLPVEAGQELGFFES